jgi:hypothetical protein
MPMTTSQLRIDRAVVSPDSALSLSRMRSPLAGGGRKSYVFQTFQPSHACSSLEAKTDESDIAREEFNLNRLTERAACNFETRQIGGSGEAEVLYQMKLHDSAMLARLTRQ